MSKTLNSATFDLPCTCGVSVIGNFSGSDDPYTKKEVTERCSDQTGFLVATFDLSENKQVKAFERLSKWFAIFYRATRVNDNTGTILTLVVFDTKE